MESSYEILVRTKEVLNKIDEILIEKGIFNG